MSENLFVGESANPNNPKWTQMIWRLKDANKRAGDLRSEFEIDYNRIIHCNAYRRLKHKTQVFFATRNDHICTRIEHVTHVNSVAYSIAKHLGLNTELATSIALGHDLGHAPFGHWGETVLSSLARNELGKIFWHEKNSLFFIDHIETLPDSTGHQRNLNLTYAVRDGIVCHCGEINENGLKPRKEFIDLEKISSPSEYKPFTWEGCVVKIADKIAYLGRDIEDALSLDILDKDQINDLRRIVNVDLSDINNTIIMHRLITDLCNQSSPEKGLYFSSQYYQLLCEIKDFNLKNIYMHPRLESYKSYSKLALETIYYFYKSYFFGKESMRVMKESFDKYPLALKTFYGWLEKYSNALEYSADQKFKNEVLYKLEDEKSYTASILDFMSGMTDNFAIRLYEEIISF